MFKILCKKYIMIVVCLFVFTPQSFAYQVEYQKLLTKYVEKVERNGVKSVGVDYIKWGKDALHNKAIAKLRKVEPSKLTGNAKKAFWINAYNLLTIDLVVQQGESESIKNLGTFLTSPWQKFSWEISGDFYTLDDIEHSILRQLGDARIHATLVSASLSCPDLSKTVFTAETLDVELDTLTKKWLENTTKGVNIVGGTAYVSKIFDWFKTDFQTSRRRDRNAVKKFIAIYLPNVDIASKTIKYIPYNWDLNIK